MLTDTERIEAEFVGQDGFFHDVAEHARLRLQRFVRCDGDVTKSIEADCERFCHLVRVYPATLENWGRDKFRRSIIYG